MKQVFPLKEAFLRDRTLAASLTIAIGSSIWGLYWLPLRGVEAAGVAGGWAVAAFNTPALIGAGLWLIWRRDGAFFSREVAAAGLLAGMGMALYALGIVTTTVVRSTLLFYLTPVWSTLIALVALGERPGRARWLALVVALVGLALILGLTPQELAEGVGVGEALGLASGVAWGASLVMIRRIGASGPALIFHQFVGVVGGGALGAFLLGWPPPDGARLLAAATPFPILGSLAIFVSMVAIFKGVALISPGRSGLLMMSEVLVAVISAAILLPEEALSPTEWVGAALIVGAGVIEVFGET